MRIFLTGASGFIGAHVTRALIERGHSLTALAVPGDTLWRLRDLEHHLTIVYGDLSNTKRLQAILARFQPEACIHLAWYAEPGKYLHSEENISCLQNSLNLLLQLSRVGCHKVVMAGSCAEYDHNFSLLHEESPTHPTTIYAASKLSCCLLGQQISLIKNIDFVWARIFYPYGPMEDSRKIIPSAIRALQQGKPFPTTRGDQVRDFIFVEDVANAFFTLIESQTSGIYNICSATPITIRELLNTIATMTGHRDLIEFGAISYRDWEPLFICGNNERLKQLGWSPLYSLSEGISISLDFWKSYIANICLSPK